MAFPGKDKNIHQTCFKRIGSHKSDDGYKYKRKSLNPKLKAECREMKICLESISIIDGDLSCVQMLRRDETLLWEEKRSVKTISVENKLNRDICLRCDYFNFIDLLIALVNVV